MSLNVSSWSIRNPVPGVLLFALLTLLGLMAFPQLNIQHFPDIEVPTIMITATQEGAAPGQLETEVARKIEDAVATLGGIEHIRTRVIDSLVTITVEFVIDKDAEVALNEVRNAIDRIRVDLPQDLNDPVISKKTVSGRALIGFAVYSEQLDEADLSWLVDNEIAKALLGVKGVGKFSRVGGVHREIQVELDPVRLNALKVTAWEVSQQLQRSRRDASGGRGDVGGAIQSFRTLAAAETIQDLAALELPLADGRRIALADIATLTDGYAERSSYALLDHKPVIEFEITRTQGWSEVAVANAVRQAVAELRLQYPHVTFQEAWDTVKQVEDNFQGSMELLYEGALLAVLVVWWFLRDWRATLIAAATLPLAIIPTFLAMKWAGFSLDTLTLLALALVVGVLVDDAIVEIENIIRHLHQGKSAYQAAMEAADEIGLAVIATTFTLVAVFLPTAFMGGIPGKFFLPFGMTAVASVLLSLLVARLLTPMLAAHLLKATPQPPKEDRWLGGYLRVVAGCLRHRHWTFWIALVFFLGSLSLFRFLPTDFVPTADRAQSLVALELPPGSSLVQTRQIAEQAISLLQQLPEVTTIFAAVGSAAASDTGPLGEAGGSDVRKATLIVNLTDRRTRARQVVIEGEMRQRLQALVGTRVTILANEPGAKLIVILASDDAVALNKAMAQVESEVRSLSGVGNITSNASLERPEISIVPNLAQAADLGITAAQIAQVVRVATAGDFEMVLPKLNLPQRQVSVRVRLQLSARDRLDAIRQLPIPVGNTTVPLEMVAEVTMGSGPTQLNRMDRLRRASLDIEVGQRVIGEVLAEVNRLPVWQQLPSGVKRPADGDAQRMAELFKSFGGAMLIGICCIYIVLVLLFHDFLQPVTILAALPLSVGGAVLALLITHHAFSMPAVIGILMLMGIVTKNSILLVEYVVMARREHGLARLEALLDACHKRARPIVMTTLAMGAGMLPVALGLGAEPSFRAPMAIVVIGGLITSTFLSLLVIPVIFTFVDDGFGWVKRRFR